MPAPSADQAARHHADFSFTELVEAYFDCRQNKRNSASALAFEQNLERNLCQLDAELRAGAPSTKPFAACAASSQTRFSSL